MDETARTPTDRMLEWALATFHTSLFILSLVFFLYGSGVLGNLLSSLNTLAGFGLFGLLWLTTWWTTRRAIGSLVPGWGKGGDFCVRTVRFSKALYKGTIWGAANGLLFFCGLVLAVLASLERQVSISSPQTFGVLLSYVLLAGTAAAAFGGAVGLVLAVVDSLLVSWVCS